MPYVNKPDFYFFLLSFYVVILRLLLLFFEVKTCQNLSVSSLTPEA